MKTLFTLLALPLSLTTMFTPAESTASTPQPVNEMSRMRDSTNQEASPKDHYSTQDIALLYELGPYKIHVKNHGITFDEQHGEITSPTEYNRLDTEFNFNHIYRITDDSNHSYYFRFGWSSYENDKTYFRNVQWIYNNPPPPSHDFVEYTISIVDIKFNQVGHTTVCTIGDSQTWWNNAQGLRKSINETFDDIVFIGSNTDTFGYPHEGEGGNDASAVLRRIQHIPSADIYTLLLGTNDWKSDPEVVVIKIQKIIDHLFTLNPDATILYLTPLPTTNTTRHAFNAELCDLLTTTFEEYKNCAIVDLRSKMLENEDWATAYFSSDGLHQNVTGVKLMGKLIGEKIQSITMNR
ncbi:SGNH/GDSL hydrolase family protein [Kiritimatiellota bacterium B12222]|nr:SGNH/GDSL hydrolase family protein [Kiritimatiellota bacterium B12222]